MISPPRSHKLCCYTVVHHVMYVIHDSLVGEETITFAYIRGRVVIRMCFPTSFIEYLWISFPLSLLLCTSPAWPGVLLYLIQTLAGYMFMAYSCCFANTKWLACFQIALRASRMLPCICSCSLSHVKRQIEAERNWTPSLWAHEHTRALDSSWWHQGHLPV